MNDLIKPQTKKTKRKKGAARRREADPCGLVIKADYSSAGGGTDLGDSTDFQKQWGLRLDEHLVTFLVSSGEISWWGWGGPGPPG